jgi:hypothetical protein
VLALLSRVSKPDDADPGGGDGGGATELEPGNEPVVSAAGSVQAAPFPVMPGPDGHFDGLGGGALNGAPDAAADDEALDFSRALDELAAVFRRGGSDDGDSDSDERLDHSGAGAGSASPRAAPQLGSQRSGSRAERQPPEFSPRKGDWKPAQWTSIEASVGDDDNDGDGPLAHAAEAAQAGLVAALGELSLEVGEVYRQLDMD